MTPSPDPSFCANDPAAPDGNVALLVPWAAAGTLSLRDSRRVAALAADDSLLAADLIAAQAEQAETVTLGEALGSPSIRPMLALFAAIDAEETQTAPSNVTRLTFDRRASRPVGMVADLRKICGRR